MSERLSKSGKLIHKMSCKTCDCPCGASNKFINELLPRMSAYKRQSHAWKSQLDESKRKNANLNDRATKAEAKVRRLEIYVENLETELTDIEVPPTIDDDEAIEMDDWKVQTSTDEDYDGWQGSDFQSMWEESDLSEDDGW